MTWIPILEGEQQQRTKDKLAEIAEALMLEHAQNRQNGLMLGKMGMALFFSYYYTYSKDKRCLHCLNDLVSEVFDALNSSEHLDYSFCYGLSGIAWTFEHLVKRGSIDPETAEALDGIDELIFESSSLNLQHSEYDLMIGAVGDGTLLLERSSQRKKAAEYLERLIDSVYAAGEFRDGCYQLQSKFDVRRITGCNLSMSHGLTGLLVLVSKCFEQNISRDRSRILAEGIVQTILRSELKNQRSLFPAYLCKDEEPGSSRLGWCYGDLGFGMGLYEAGVIFKNQNWQEKALEILRATSLRRNLSEERIFDAGLCHGTAGIAHCFSRILNSSKLEVFREAALFWHEETLRYAKHEKGLAGYKTMNSRNELEAQSGLLEGLSGTGLYLLSSVSEINPEWDRCLLLS
jgi:lantibiotic modifying enzyme